MSRSIRIRKFGVDMLVETCVVHRGVWLCCGKKKAQQCDIRRGSYNALMIPALSKLLLKRLPREVIDALRGVRGVREPSPRIARFCSIWGVSRGASGRRESPSGIASRERIAERRRASASNSIRRTSSSTAPSSSGDLCLPLLLDAFARSARNFLFGGCDGPATALLLSEDG